MTQKTHRNLITASRKAPRGNKTITTIISWSAKNEDRCPRFHHLTGTIGDRTPGLVKGTDGSLEIHLQNARPEEAQRTNWLPAPAGPMRLVLRAYEPEESLLDGSWRMPPVRKVS